MREKQTNIRALWTIFTLIDGEEKSQTEIVKDLKKTGEEISDSSESTQLIKTTNAIESPIIKDLTNKNIIKRELKDVEGSNLKANICKITNRTETLVNIVDEIENSVIDETRKNYFISKLINSKLGQEHINIEILVKLLQNQEATHIEFKDSEKDLILLILLNSPQALKYTTKSIQNKQKEWQLNEAKEYYFYKILSLLNLDLLEQHLQQPQHNKIRKIQYETKITIQHNQKTGKKLTADINPEYTQFYFLQDIKKS